VKYEELPRGLPGTDARTGAAPRALWMPPDTVVGSDFWRYTPEKLALGTIEGQRIGIADNRHLMTIAGSRAGKGTSVIVPNLLLYPGSVLVLDPKGENATLTAERRGEGREIAEGGLGHEVYVIDPFRVADVPEEYRAGFNPFAALDPESPNFIDDCDSIADALVVAEPGRENDHWNASARMVLRGLVAWVAAADTIRERDLTTLRRLLHLPSELGSGDDDEDPETDPLEDDSSFEYLLAEMSASPKVGYGVPAEAAMALIGMSLRERGSVLSTVRQNLAFLSSPPVADSLSGEQRRPTLRDWKFGNTTIYLCLPAGRLHRHSRLFRVFVNQLLVEIEHVPQAPEIPALMILDEMHVLGHMAALETAAGLLAGYGVRIWSIWQDMNQLKHLYSKRWETFMGNSGILQFFGLNDQTTLEYVSKRLGTSSVMSISKSEISREQIVKGFTGESKSIQAVPLLAPEEVAYFFSRQSGNQLVLYPGADPIFMRRTAYYEDPFFADFLPAGGPKP